MYEKPLTNSSHTVNFGPVTFLCSRSHPLNCEDEMTETTVTIVVGALALVVLTLVGCYGFNKDRN